MKDSPEPDAKVLFRVEYEDDDEVDVETLWAFDLGDDRYRLDNLPYFAYGVSLNDVVYAPFDPEEERATFKAVLEKSGNRTIRIVFDVPVSEGNESKFLLDKLASFGCDVENANSKLVVVNIPPSIDLHEAAALINQEGVTWEYTDPTYEELFGPDNE